MGNRISLQRSPKDNNKLLVQVYDHHSLRERFMGGTPHASAKISPEDMLMLVSCAYQSLQAAWLTFRNSRTRRTWSSRNR